MPRGAAPPAPQDPPTTPSEPPPPPAWRTTHSLPQSQHGQPPSAQPQTARIDNDEQRSLNEHLPPLTEATPDSSSVPKQPRSLWGPASPKRQEAGSEDGLGVNGRPRLTTERSRLQRQPGQPLAPQLDPLPLKDQPAAAGTAAATSTSASVVSSSAAYAQAQLTNGAVLAVHTQQSNTGIVGSQVSSETASECVDSASGDDLSEPHGFAFQDTWPAPSTWMQNPIPLQPKEPTDEWFFPSGTFKCKEVSPPDSDTGSTDEIADIRNYESLSRRHMQQQSNETYSSPDHEQGSTMAATDVKQ